MTHARLDRARAVLDAGGVVLMPTDTLPGLHARWDRPAAVARIRELKGRAAARPLLLLCADADAALALAPGADPRAAAWARRCWPGPFTLVLPVRPEVARAVNPAGTTAGLRVPGSDPLRALLAAVGAPLVSTSANRSGAEPARTVAEAAALFGEDVDLVLDAPWGGAGAASAVVDVTGWPPRTLRAGPRPLPSW